MVDKLRHHQQLLVTKCRSYCQAGDVHGEAGKEFAQLITALRQDAWRVHLGDLGELLASFGGALDEVGSVSLLSKLKSIYYVFG